MINRLKGACTFSGFMISVIYASRRFSKVASLPSKEGLSWLYLGVGLFVQ